MEQSTKQDRATIAILVENSAGVLARVAGLFGRRGYNIDSLTVSETNSPGISRITVVTHGSPREIEQIMLQTEKLVDTIAVSLENDMESIQRELLLVKVKAAESQRRAIRDICEVYKASIVDLSPESLAAELTGKPAKIDGFLEMLGGYTILELYRTGVTAMDRGSKVMCRMNEQKFAIMH